MIFIAWCQTVNVMINIQINTGLIQSIWSTFILLGYYMVKENVGKHKIIATIMNYVLKYICAHMALAKTPGLIKIFLRFKLGRDEFDA